MTAPARLFRHIVWMARFSDRKTFARFLLAILRTVPAIVRSRDLGPADALMAGKPTRFKTCREAWVTIEGDFFSLAREIYARRSYTFLSDFGIREDDLVVDLGANVGVFSLLAASCGANVVAVEAQSELIPLLHALFKKNKLEDRVVIEHGLIAGDVGVFASEASRRAASHWGSQPVDVTMDALMAKHQIKTIDLMKIDIEGSEFELLRAPGMWIEHVDRIVMEYHPEFGDVDEIKNVLIDNGFRVTLVGTDFNEISVAQPDALSGYLFALRLDVG